MIALLATPMRYDSVGPARDPSALRFVGDTNAEISVLVKNCYIISFPREYAL